MADSPGLLLFSTVMVLCSYFKKCKRPTVHVGNPNNHALLAACPTLSQVFWASPFCWNEHVQLMFFVYSPFRPSFQWRREIIVLSDGEELALDWVSAPQNKNIYNGDHEDDIAPSGELTESPADTPILMLHHGSTCDSYDLPSQDYIRPALDRGWIVCALNRRGHALPLTRPKANFFGCCDDLHEVSQQLLKKRPNTRLLTIGISAGSALVARHFGKDASFNDFTAGVAIAPGYDVSVAMSRVAWPYAGVMLKTVKHFFQHCNQHLFESKYIPGLDEAMKAETFQEWLDHSYGLAGYESKEEYYRHSNPMNYVYNVPESKPLMAINAEDDPICVKQNIDETVKSFQNHSGWHKSGATLVTSKSGSHCPFYEGIRMNCWAERLAFEFLDAALVKAKLQEE